MIFPLRLLVWVLPVLLFAVPAVAFALYLAAVLGSPGSCVGEDRPITFTLQAASSFQEKWDQLNASLDAGQPATEPYSVPHLTSTIMHTLLDVGQLRIAQSVPSDVVRIATGSDPIGPLL